MCKSKFLENIRTISIDNVTTPILECIFACKYFKKLESLFISGVFKSKVLENVLTKSINNFGRLKYLKITHENNDEKLDEIVKNCALKTNNPTLLFSSFVSTNDNECLFKAAELNHLPAILYILTHNVATPTENFKWLLKGSELGDFNLQMMITDLFIQAKEYERAMQWFSKAIESKRSKLAIIQAARKFGLHFYEEGDFDKSIELFRISAERGDSTSQYFLGCCYNIRKDYTNAFKWFVRSAEKGHDVSQYNIGHIYEYGNGLDIDYTKAFQWYMKSALQENTDSQIKVGEFYQIGRGIEKDLINSFEWHLKAAIQGDSFAKITIAFLYCNGKGTLSNMNESLKWLISSCNENECSHFIIDFMVSFGLLNHLNRQAISNNFSQITDSELANEFSSDDCCEFCEGECKGFYYRNENCDDPFNICGYCWNSNDDTKLEELKLKIGNRILVKTHMLQKFLPLIENCKSLNQINNTQLDEIISQLKQLNS